MIERTVYQCEHCKLHKTKPKIYFSSYRMWEHEHSCFYNPKNQTCFTCAHNDYYQSVYTDEYGIEGYRGGNHCYNEDAPEEHRKVKRLPIVNCPHWVDEREVYEDGDI